MIHLLLVLGRTDIFFDLNRSRVPRMCFTTIVDWRTLTTVIEKMSMMQVGRKSFEKVQKEFSKMKKKDIKNSSKNPKTPLKIEKKNYKKIKNRRVASDSGYKMTNLCASFCT